MKLSKDELNAYQNHPQRFSVAQKAKQYLAVHSQQLDQAFFHELLDEGVEIFKSSVILGDCCKILKAWIQDLDSFLQVFAEDKLKLVQDHAISAVGLVTKWTEDSEQFANRILYPLSDQDFVEKVVLFLIEFKLAKEKMKASHLQELRVFEENHASLLSGPPQLVQVNASHVNPVFDEDNDEDGPAQIVDMTNPSSVTLEEAELLFDGVEHLLSQPTLTVAETAIVTKVSQLLVFNTPHSNTPALFDAVSGALRSVIDLAAEEREFLDDLAGIVDWPKDAPVHKTVPVVVIYNANKRQRV
jgi:hypothetical protein